ncbi:MAG TPA: undecaprenyl-diphosphatase UppP [archaeon]|nr:undecaprenyl-diphosphatase UppP [archaeon]
MDFITAAILGIVEGITEFLPISSTGHMILASQLLNIQQTDFVKTFEIAVQLGAILSVVVLYWKSFFLNMKILKRLAVAFIPTGVIGFVLYRIFKQFLLGNTAIVLASLLFGGVFIILFEKFYPKKEKIEKMEKIPYRHCLVIGIFQSISIIPGVSRAAPAILGGLALGLKKRAIVEFSFLLAVPTFLAAAGYDLIQSAGGFSLGQLDLLAVGFVTAFAVAILAIKTFLNYIKKNNFTIFGIYRIIIALLFFAFVLGLGF